MRKIWSVLGQATIDTFFDGADVDRNGIFINDKVAEQRNSVIHPRKLIAELLDDFPDFNDSWQVWVHLPHCAEEQVYIKML